MGNIEHKRWTSFLPVCIYLCVSDGLNNHSSLNSFRGSGTSLTGTKGGLGSSWESMFP